MKNISEMWDEFLLWVEDYTDGDSEKVIQYSREDMRYAYQAGYESFYKSLVKKVDPDNLPEEPVFCVINGSGYIAELFNKYNERREHECVYAKRANFEINHYIEQKDLINYLNKHTTEVAK